MSLTSPEHHYNVSSPESLSNLERQLDLYTQFTRIKRALSQVGLLDLLLLTPPTKGIEPIGTVGSNGVEYPLFTYHTLQKAIKDNHIFLKNKAEQGFTELRIIPETMPLTGTGGLEQRFSELLIRHNDQIPYSRVNPEDKPQLLGTRHPRNTDELIQLSFNALKLLDFWDGIAQAEKSNTLIYYPSSFNKDNPGGYTKTQLIQAIDNTPFPGFGVFLARPYTFLNNTNDTPHHYLKNAITQNKVGMTIAHFLTDFAVRLFLTNQVSYDYYDKSGAWLIGNFASGRVPYGYLYRNRQRMGVYGSDPDDLDGFLGCPSAVRVCALE